MVLYGEHTFQFVCDISYFLVHPITFRDTWLGATKSHNVSAIHPNLSVPACVRLHTGHCCWTPGSRSGSHLSSGIHISTRGLPRRSTCTPWNTWRTIRTRIVYPQRNFGLGATSVRFRAVSKSCSDKCHGGCLKCNTRQLPASLRMSKGTSESYWIPLIGGCPQYKFYKTLLQPDCDNYQL